MSRPLDPLFRQAQQDAIQYRSGTMAIAAVPGSGKTFTLAHLAARMVSRMSKSDLLKEREILVVTFTNSAVNSLRRKIAQILQRDRGLLPYIGYRVRTLHGLAHDIVRERPALLGLTEDFRILDEQTSRQIIRELTESNLRQYGDVFKSYVYPDLLTNKKQSNQILNHAIPDLAFQISERFIKHCKDNLLTPGDFYASEMLEQFPLARFGLRVYDDYQRNLAYRGAVDFDDLVRLALIAIQENSDFRGRLQKRWPFILEDEAQDSSALQEKMLNHLAASHHNWIRVGDPNQAINTTFTTANPRYLREFTAQADTLIELKQSGRSGMPIADLANALLEWALADHPVPELRQAFDYRLIEPTLPGDPQPNPPMGETSIHIHYQTDKNISPDQELRLTLQSLQRWLPDNKDKTVAVLVPENSRGFKLIELLQQAYLPCEELLRSTSTTREVANALQAVLGYLANPLNPSALSRVYHDVWWGWNLGRIKAQQLPENVDLDEIIEAGTKSLAQYQTLEDFLWPVNQLPELKALVQHPVLEGDFLAFGALMRHWLQATILPIDQLVLTIAQDLFHDPTDLALSYKMALSLRSAQELHPEWRMAEFILELQTISENERRFVGMEDMVTGYEPKPGVITVATMHAAKGLEWDRVYLLAVNNYSFPSVQPGDNFISEKWFVRDQLNLEAEILAQVDAIKADSTYIEGDASGQARLDYAAERLRLLYVGITRARHELVILWNTGRFGYKGDHLTCQPALPLTILLEYLAGTRVIKGS